MLAEPAGRMPQAARIDCSVSADPASTRPRPVCRMNLRREIRRPAPKARAKARSIWVSSSRIGLWLLFVLDPRWCRRSIPADDERVLRLPRQAYALAVRQHLARAARFQVLGVDGQAPSIGRFDEVLGADTDVRRVEHAALDGVRVRIGLLRLALRQRVHSQLLRPDADADPRRVIEGTGWHLDVRPIRQAQVREAAVALLDLGVEQVADAEEPRNELGGRALV